MTVYADILFLTNFLINSVIIYLAQRLAYLKISYFKILLAAAFGSIYAVAVFVCKIDFLSSLLLKFAVSCAMIYIANGFIQLRDFIKAVSLLYVTSFICCGAATAIMYIKNQSGITVTSDGTAFVSLNLGCLIGATAITTVTVYFAARLRRRKMQRSFENITIGLSNKNISIKALVDTGNLLYEPLSGYPVVIVEFSCLKSILPENFNPSNDDILAYNDMKIRYIPFSALGNSDDMMVGFIPDFLTVNGRNTKCCVAVYNGNLSQKHEYCALVSPDICCNSERSKVYE